MKKNIAIGIMAGLAVIFLLLWRFEVRISEFKEKQIAVIAEVIDNHLKEGQGNFEWQEFVRKAGVEKLLAKSLEGASGQKEQDIRTEIEKRLLGYPREINFVESREMLIKKLLKDSFGQELLDPFIKEARETIRLYEEEKKNE